MPFLFASYRRAAAVDSSEWPATAGARDWRLFAGLPGLLHHGPERLGNGVQVRQAGPDELDSHLRISQQIVRKDSAATARLHAITVKAFLDIQRSVVVGEFLAGLDVMDRQFKVMKRRWNAAK